MNNRSLLNTVSLHYQSSLLPKYVIMFSSWTEKQNELWEHCRCSCAVSRMHHTNTHIYIYLFHGSKSESEWQDVF